MNKKDYNSVVDAVKTMSFKELHDIQDIVNKQINEVQAAETESLRKEMEELAAKRGMTVEQLFPQTATNTPQKIAAKFKGPNGEMWGGRGRKPNWVIKALDEGKTLDDFRINKPADEQKTEEQATA